MEDIDRRWRKSSYSGNGGECVEVGHARDVIVVRDTSQDQAGPVLRFSPAAWRRFADRVKRSLASGLEPGSAGPCEGRSHVRECPFRLVRGRFLARWRGELPGWLGRADGAPGLRSGRVALRPVTILRGLVRSRLRADVACYGT